MGGFGYGGGVGSDGCVGGGEVASGWAGEKVGTREESIGYGRAQV